MLLKSLQILNYVIYSIFLYEVSGTIYFQEEFLDGDKWQERWILTEHPSQEWGFFILTAGKFYGHPEESKGVQTFQNAMKYGMSTKFHPFSNKGKPLVIQYTVKNEQKLECGGGYIKLFNCSFQPTELHDKTPYLLMFGPDKCSPTTLKTHVIFNYKGKYLEMKKNIAYTDDTLTHLYTLVINPDNTYSIKIDNKDVASGKLKEDWDFLPPEEIPDIKARKPKDWVENEMMHDPLDKKPSDLNDFNSYIPDPSAKKPDYKGHWKPRLVPNPDYRGPWVRPKIKNPKFVDDPELYKFDEICALGFDIYQTEAGTIFDNILITDDVEFAEEQSWKTWGELKDGEKQMARELSQKVTEREQFHDEL